MSFAIGDVDAEHEPGMMQGTMAKMILVAMTTHV